MDIKGLDYNTQRPQLVMPEYGREVQDMVNYCMTITSRPQRQRCAETIIHIMERMFPQNKSVMGYKQKLWDHLAIMSDFKLDIDYPFDVQHAHRITTKPKPMPYPMRNIPVKHYGNMVFQLFDKLKQMPAGTERDELTGLTANLMKYDLYQWGHGYCDNEKVASDLAKYTDGKIQLDLNTFRFNKIDMRPQNNQSQNNQRKRKKK